MKKENRAYPAPRPVRKGNDYKAKDIRRVGFLDPVADTFSDVARASVKFLRDHDVYDNTAFNYGSTSEDFS